MTKEPKTYSKEETYKKRDVIYHPQFKEHGKVVKVEPQATMQILTVEFEESGTKKLIAGIE